MQFTAHQRIASGQLCAAIEMENNFRNRILLTFIVRPFPSI